MMKIPTTHSDPIYIYSHTWNKHDRGGGVEYKGRLFISHGRANDMAYTAEELWFIARVTEEKKKRNSDSKRLNSIGSDEIAHLSKIWATKTTIGCSYSDEIEDLLQECHKVLYCL